MVSFCLADSNLRWRRLDAEFERTSCREKVGSQDVTEVHIPKPDLNNKLCSKNNRSSFLSCNGRYVVYNLTNGEECYSADFNCKDESNSFQEI